MFMSEFPTKEKAITVSKDFSKIDILTEIRQSYLGKLEEASYDIKLLLKDYSKNAAKNNKRFNDNNRNGDGKPSKRKLILDREYEHFDEEGDVIWQFNPALKLSGVDNWDLSIKQYLKQYFKVDGDLEEDAFENNFGQVMESIVQVLDPIMYSVVHMSWKLDVRRWKGKL